MKPELQRIAIAQACGWSFDQKTQLWKNPHGVTVAFGELDMPDYLNDLNAMHEAVSCLSYTQQITYGRILWHVTEPSYASANAGNNLFRLAHATAAQCCEAFLKTLGLYTP